MERYLSRVQVHSANVYPVRNNGEFDCIRNTVMNDFVDNLNIICTVCKVSGKSEAYMAMETRKFYTFVCPFFWRIELEGGITNVSVQPDLRL